MSIRIPVGVETSAFRSGMREMTGDVMGFQRVTEGAFNRMSVASLAATGLALSQVQSFVSSSIQELRRFEGQLANIHTLMNFGEPIAAIREEIKLLSRETGKDINDWAGAFEDLYSVDLGHVRDQLVGPINDLALAINISGNQATELMTKSLKAFSLEAAEAGRVADVLTATIGVAAAPGEELSAAFGTLASDARTYNVSLESTMALWAALNVQGIESATAATVIGNLWAQLANPTTKGGKFFEDETGMSFLEFIDEVDGNAIAVIERLNRVMQETDLAPTDILTQRRAGQALSVASGSGFGLTEDLFNQIAGSQLEAASRAGRVRSGVEWQRQQSENEMRILWQDAVGAWDQDVISPLKQNIAIATETLGPIPMTGGTLIGAGVGAFLGGPVGAALGGGIGFLSTTAIGQLIDALKGDDTDEELEEINRELTEFEELVSRISTDGGLPLFEDSSLSQQKSSVIQIAIEYSKLVEEAEKFKGTQKEQELNQEAMNLLLEAGVTDISEFMGVVTQIANQHFNQTTGWFANTRDELVEALKTLGLTNSEILELELGTYGVVTAAEDADNKFKAWGASIANADEELESVALTLQDLGLWHSEYLGGPRFRQAHQEAFDADRKFVDPTGNVFGTDNSGLTVGGGGGSGSSGAVAVRITPESIYGLAQSAARSFAATGEPLEWYNVQSHLSALIYDDKQFMEQTGVNRGFADARLSDFSQGDWSTSPFWYLFADEKEAADERERQRLEQEEDRQNRLAEQRERVAQAEMDRLKRAAERERELANQQYLTDARQRIAGRGAENYEATRRIFDLVLGAAGAEQFSQMTPNPSMWTDMIQSFGYKGNNPGIGYATFEKMWWDWFKDYRDKLLAGELYGAEGEGNVPDLDFGWSADIGSTARLAWGSISTLRDYVHQRDCDFASEQRRTNELLEEGNEERRKQGQVGSVAVVGAAVPPTSFVGLGKTSSVVPNV